MQRLDHPVLTTVNTSAPTHADEPASAGSGEGDRPIARRKLTKQQELEIRDLINSHTPDELGLPYGLWNKVAVRDIIAARVHILLPTTTLGGYLLCWGFVPEKTLSKAHAQQPTVIRLWVRHQYPLIMAQAKAERGEILWGDALVANGLNDTAPPDQGATRTGSRQQPRTMLSMASSRGMIQWMMFQGPITARILLEFFKRAIRDREQKLFLIAPCDALYSIDPVASWLAAHADRFQLFQLPAVERAPMDAIDDPDSDLWKTVHGDT
ncbi:MAG: hypothetical protein ABI432_06200 [Flavobacteriales bacterium]